MEDVGVNGKTVYEALDWIRWIELSQNRIQ
jgi:hypothetical protein